MNRLKFFKQYSGKQSESFWDMVNSLKDDKVCEAIYSLGCIIQQCEYAIEGQLRRKRG